MVSWWFTIVIFLTFVIEILSDNKLNTNVDDITTGDFVNDLGHHHFHDDVNASITEEQRLLQFMLHQYDSASRPTYNASHTVVVRFQLTLVQISQLDEVNQVLTTNVWLEQEWVDERLNWNASDFSGLHTIRIPCNKLWLPDIVLYNSADDFTSGYMQSKAMVSSNGRVFWPPPAKLRSTCKIDITYFPFDDQSCTMKFGSWTYDGYQVNVTKRHDEVDTSNYVHSGEWNLMRVDVIRNEVSYPCCPEPYPDVTFTIVMRRRTLYYLFNIIFPCLWLTVLSLLGFCLPPDSGEKITLGITVLLAFSVFMLLIAENMPATSEFVPLIGIYLTVTMATTSLSIVLTVVVLHLHHIGPNHRPVPPLVKSFFFDTVARILCMQTVRRYQRRNNLRKKRFGTPPLTTSFSTKMNPKASTIEHGKQGRQEAIPMSRSSMAMGDKFAATASTSISPIEAIPCNGRFFESYDNTQRASHKSTASTNQNLSGGKNIDFLKSNVQKKRSLVLPSANVGTQNSISVLSLAQQDQYLLIMRHLFNLINKQEEEEMTQETINDWRMLAYVVDRMLFWLFLVAATLSTIVILIIVPLFKENI